MKPNPVGWFEIYVQNIEQARDFYETVFQVKLERLNSPEGMEIEMWAFPMVEHGNGAPGTLVKMKDGPSGGNSVLVYFTCDDCASEAARAATSGGKIVKEKMPIGQYGFIALVADTEGNIIGLHSMQ